MKQAELMKNLEDRVSHMDTSMSDLKQLLLEYMVHNGPMTPALASTKASFAHASDDDDAVVDDYIASTETVQEAEGNKNANGEMKTNMSPTMAPSLTSWNVVHPETNGVDPET